MGKGYIKKTPAQMVVDSFNRAQSEQLFVEKLNPQEFIVTNADHMTVYKVICENGHIVDCDCPHHIYREVICKHMVAVAKETNLPLL